MPFAITCPSCGQPITVHEASVGYTIGCPHCRRPLTVPPTVPPPPATEEPPAFPTADEPAPRRSRYSKKAKPTNGTLLVIAAVVLAVLVLAGGVTWYLTKTDPEIARVEAEYSEVCDEIDRATKLLKERGIAVDSMVGFEVLNPLRSRKLELEIQFNRKYGKMPRHLPFGKRDYSNTPIR